MSSPCPRGTCSPRPDALGAAEAATIPIVFATAQIAFELAELKTGEKVLIHAAAGGVGLAAIQLAQTIGAEIYTTVSVSKQGYLRELGIEHVYDSRSTNFGEQILRDTDGAGVDVILNSLTSELPTKPRSLGVVRARVPSSLAYRRKSQSEYHRQSRVENTVHRYKSIIGDRLRARHPQSQKAEAVVARNILNRMTGLRRLEPFAVGN